MRDEGNSPAPLSWPATRPMSRLTSRCRYAGQ